jgi:hypothetical protein
MQEELSAFCRASTTASARIRTHLGFGMLELYGHGTRAGRLVRVDPQRVMIVGNGGFVEVLATGAEWTATMPSGEDDVKVRILADPQGGSVHMKSSD